MPTDDQPQAEHAGEQQLEIKFDDSKFVTAYANFCRVTGTPEELIVDFGLNPQPLGIPIITQRIVTNYFTAKRMLHVLQAWIQRHEAIFGPIEVDVQKRMRPAARAQMTPPAAGK